jgi:Domain of unknown function (DUF4340)
MKNKHLVFIFGLTLLFGLVTKGLPWIQRSLIERRLLNIQPESLVQIQIQYPDGRQILLERGEKDWFSAEEGRGIRVPADTLAPLFERLANLKQAQLLKAIHLSDFLSALVLDCQFKHRDGHIEHFKIGAEKADGTAMLYLPSHEGYYAVQGHLSAFFPKNLNTFRATQPLDFLPDHIRRIDIYSEEDTLQLTLHSGNWLIEADTQKVLPPNSVEHALQQLTAFKNLTFADEFDEVSAQSDRLFELMLYEAESADPHRLAVYTDPARRGQLVLQGSDFPANFYLLRDTAMLRQIFYNLTESWKKN